MVLILKAVPEGFRSEAIDPSNIPPLIFMLLGPWNFRFHISSINSLPVEDGGFFYCFPKIMSFVGIFFGEHWQNIYYMFDTRVQFLLQ